MHQSIFFLWCLTDPPRRDIVAAFNQPPTIMNTSLAVSPLTSNTPRLPGDLDAKDGAESATVHSSATMAH